MKKLIGIVALFIAVFMMSGCSGNSPKAVAEKSLSCMQDEDWEGYVNLMYFKEKEGKKLEREKEQYAALLKAKGGAVLDEKGGIKSYEIISEEIAEDGNTATVTAKVVYGNGKDTENQKVKLVKDDNGDWKLSSNK